MGEWASGAPFVVGERDGRRDSPEAVEQWALSALKSSFDGKKMRHAWQRVQVKMICILWPEFDESLMQLMITDQSIW